LIEALTKLALMYERLAGEMAGNTYPVSGRHLKEAEACRRLAAWYEGRGE